MKNLFRRIFHFMQALERIAPFFVAMALLSALATAGVLLCLDVFAPRLEAGLEVPIWIVAAVLVVALLFWKGRDAFTRQRRNLDGRPDL